MANKTPTIPVMHLYHNLDGEIYRCNVREDKVYLKNGKVAQFNNRSLFTVTDRLGRRPRKIKIILYYEGKATACYPQSWQEIKNKFGSLEYMNMLDEQVKNKTINLEPLQTLPPNCETLFEPLTDNDRITVVKREIAKQLGKFKPMETWQFGVLMAIGIASIVLNFIF